MRRHRHPEDPPLAEGTHRQGPGRRHHQRHGVSRRSVEILRHHPLRGLHAQRARGALPHEMRRGSGRAHDQLRRHHRLYERHSPARAGPFP